MKKSISVGWVLLTLFLIISCGGGGSSGSGSGTLSLGLTDASTDQYKAVYVTIDDVQVHLGGNENTPGNWKSVEMPTSPITLNLLDLVNGVRENLGLATLPSGHYTQMRLIIGRTPDNSINVLSQAHLFANYVIDQNDPANIHELKVPSGYNTGFKIVRGFDIGENQTTELILDFDAARSVVEAGSSGNWLLQPTVKVADLREYAIINGTITTNTASPAGIAGALVSVQTYNSGAADAADQVEVAAATITDENGDYQLFVTPGAYNLIVYKDGYQVSFSEIVAVQEAMTTEDKALDEAITGMVDGAVIISGADSVEQYATISFRKAVEGASEEKIIEIKSINTLNSFGYPSKMLLPVNEPSGESYIIVASTFGYPSETYEATVLQGQLTTLEITIPRE